ncbi:MAG: B12-binding domain-containing radical SAM protein [Candidatus Thorarchaeota archaeon]
MRVVLVATHQVSLGKPVPLYRCLGILSLAASLRSRGIECEVVDLVEFNISDEQNSMSQLTRVSHRVLSKKPDLVGFSTMSNNLAIALHISQMIKSDSTEILTVLGGPGASFCAKRIVDEFTQVDFVIRGEADDAFPDFIESLIKSDKIPATKGLVFREGGKVRDYGWPDPIKNLDGLPIPLYELSEKESLRIDESVSLEAGRGCPFGCIFCSTSTFFKRKYRVKSVDRIRAEIEEIRTKLGERNIIFNHDLLTFDRQWMEDLCSCLEDYSPRVRWGCSARSDTLDREILYRMRKAGCERIFLGVETATEKMQGMIRKNLDLEGLLTVAKDLVELDYKATLSFIVGFPEQDNSDIQAMWNLIFQLKAIGDDRLIIQVHSLAPELGSKMYDDWKQHLVYDDFGCPGHTDLPPVSWSTMREVIKSHPGIFAMYYHYNAGEISRADILKYVGLSRILEQGARFSLKEASLLLGNGLATVLIESVDRLPLSHPSQDGALMRSLRNVITSELGADSTEGRQYDAIAQYEIAAAEVIEEESEDFARVIEVYFNPLKIIEKDSSGGVNSEERKRFLVVTWDNEKGTVVSAEVPEAISRLLVSEPEQQVLKENKTSRVI